MSLKLQGKLKHANWNEFSTKYDTSATKQRSGTFMPPSTRSGLASSNRQRPKLVPQHQVFTKWPNANVFMFSSASDGSPCTITNKHTTNEYAPCTIRHNACDLNCNTAQVVGGMRSRINGNGHSATIRASRNLYIVIIPLDADGQ